MEKVAFYLKSGEISKPFADKDGWNIIRVTQIIPPVLSSLVEHKEEVRQALIEQKRRIWSGIISETCMKKPK